MHIRRRRVLEHILLGRGLLTEAQLAASSVKERARPSPLVAAVAKHCAVPFVDVRSLHIERALWDLVPFEIADKHVLIPLSRDGNTLKIAMADPNNLFAIDDVKFLTQLAVEVVVADEEDLVRVIHTEHHRIKNRPFTGSMDEGHNDAAVGKLVNMIIVDAVKRRAREILIEPRATEAVVLFAFGPTFMETMRPPKKLVPAMIARLQAMACGTGWFTLKDVIDVDMRLFPTRFGMPQVSLRLFGRDPIDLFDDTISLPAFADAARILPGPIEGRVDVRTAKGWRPTWTYPLTAHAALVARQRAASANGENLDVSDDECANGVRLFLRKRS